MTEGSRGQSLRRAAGQWLNTATRLRGLRIEGRDDASSAQGLQLGGGRTAPLPKRCSGCGVESVGVERLLALENVVRHPTEAMSEKRESLGLAVFLLQPGQQLLAPGIGAHE